MMATFLFIILPTCIAVVACILYKKYIGDAGDIEDDDDDDYPWEGF